MFDIDTVATIYLYIEYIIPIALFIIIALYYIAKVNFLKLKIYRLHREHSVEKQYNETYWYTYVCKDCGKTLYKQPSGVNTQLDKDDYIFRYTGKCIKEN
jgi:hypothetical protein